MKRTTKKLELNPQTIRQLLTPDLTSVVGGMQRPNECTGKLSGCGVTDVCKPTADC